MTSLVGISLLGQTFVQDPNPLFVKINGVAIGESSQFGYNTLTNMNITSLLFQAIQDSNVVCIVYNWTSGVGYLKSGFNLSVSSDSKLAPGYTTFVLNSKVSHFYKPIPPVVSSFVKWNASKSQFEINGNKFVPVGFNAFYLGLLQETNYYPNHKQIEEAFIAANKLSATVIRSHTLGISCGSPVSLLPNGNGNGSLNNTAWDSIDYAFYCAKKYNVKLICPLLDVYNYYNGSYQVFTDTYNISKNSFFTDFRAINDFKSYIHNWLNHKNAYTNILIKNSPELAFIETGNEFNIRPAATSYIYPPQSWIQDITTYIKSQTLNILVLDGSDEGLGGSVSNDFNITTVDCFTNHFYWEDYTRLNSTIAKCKNLGKPMIIGEYSSQFGQDFFNAIENAGINGSAFWSLYPSTVSHNDGYTLSWVSTNEAQLVLLSNHMRRMQNLPQITSLAF